MNASASCFWLLRSVVAIAFILALASVGNSIAARMAMIAITTSSSIRVNPSVSSSFGELFSSLFSTVVRMRNHTLLSLQAHYNSAFCGSTVRLKAQPVLKGGKRWPSRPVCALRIAGSRQRQTRRRHAVMLKAGNHPVDVPVHRLVPEPAKLDLSTVCRCRDLRQCRRFQPFVRFRMAVCERGGAGIIVEIGRRIYPTACVRRVRHGKGPGPGVEIAGIRLFDEDHRSRHVRQCVQLYNDAGRAPIAIHPIGLGIAVKSPGGSRSLPLEPQIARTVVRPGRGVIRPERPLAEPLLHEGYRLVL